MHNLSRRRALKAGAWTAPAIVAISAAPAFANTAGGPIADVVKPLTSDMVSVSTDTSINTLTVQVYPLNNTASAVSGVSVSVHIGGPGVDAYPPVSPLTGTLPSWNNTLFKVDEYVGAFVAGEAYLITVAVTVVGYSGSVSYSTSYTYPE